MPSDGSYTAVLDRFEEGREGRLAVLVLEADGEDSTGTESTAEDRTEAAAAEDVGELAVSPEELPGDARHQDAVLDVVVEDGALVAATYREEETSRRREDAQSRFDRLSRRPDEANGDEVNGDEEGDGDGTGSHRND